MESKQQAGARESLINFPSLRRAAQWVDSFVLFLQQQMAKLRNAKRPCVSVLYFLLFLLFRFRRQSVDKIIPTNIMKQTVSGLTMTSQNTLNNKHAGEIK